MKRALFFANGEVTQREIQKIENETFDVIIAADGGALNALVRGYPPNYVVGDLDSITQGVKDQLPESEFLHHPSQELNDLEKTLIACEELGVTDITLLGLTGKRLDHTLNNLSVLSRYDQKFNLTIYDAYSQIFFVRDEWHFSGKINQLISLIPLGAVEGVTTQGLAFPLNKEPLIFGKRESLSNYVVTGPVSIRIKNGLLVVFVIEY